MYTHKSHITMLELKNPLLHGRIFRIFIYLCAFHFQGLIEHGF
jgi:hypothetical protein